MSQGFLSSLSAGQKAAVASVVGVVVIAVLVGIYSVFPTASNQGYRPKQPIPFSHKLHAGKNNIDCQYCHTAADQSQHASVPSMGTCMNCHLAVKTESPHIKKLTKYYKEGKPIEWIKVHDLPDFVFFNHERHIEKGISCEKCHGDVSSMERMKQAKPLTMGWCMRCHRGETTPKEVLEKLRSEKDIHGRVFQKEGQVAPTSCSTCHY